jgi:4-hydroxybenzoate polyprenyltransferase
MNEQLRPLSDFVSPSDPKFAPWQMDNRTRADSDIPLVVDLDGTLCKVDTLHEALIQMLTLTPIQALRALLAVPTRGRAAFKAAVADHVLPNVGTLPIDDAVLATIRQAKENGRRVYLATAADRRVANAVAACVSEFDGVFASEHDVNLKGKAKADRLVEAFGVQGFDYLGNAVADIPVWGVARTVLISKAPPRLVRRVSSELPSTVILNTRTSAVGPYLRALRPHQWLKNGLVALPAIADHAFSLNSLVIILTAMASFSLGASAIYLVNDMLDLPHDRAHPKKRYRSLAAGTVSIQQAVVMVAITAALSVALALTLPWAFLAILAIYFALSMSYSVYLKRKLMIDVVTLAALYGVRVMAGSAATGIPLSDWLIGFCFFIFLSLALMKRTAEMMTVPEDSVDKIKGRGYRRVDLPTMSALSVAAGFVAVLVLALYINSPEVRPLYRHPELLWGICMVLVYWIGRACFLTRRSEMNQDPVIFAVTDRVSLLAGILVLAIFIVAL